MANEKSTDKILDFNKMLSEFVMSTVCQVSSGLLE